MASQSVAQSLCKMVDEIQIALAVKLVFVGTDATLPLTFDTPSLEGNMVLDEAQTGGIY